MKFCMTVFLIVLLAACATAQSDTTTFTGGMEGWTAGFADYPAGQESFFDLAALHTSLPAPLDSTQRAVMLSGDNHSDDLFMYLKKQITGLVPNTTYLVQFDVELASNASTTAVGVGGAPGLAVTVKCGAAVTEPVRVLDAMQYYRMNIDIGNQANPGADMDTIGNVGVTDTTTVYTLVTRSNATHRFTVKSDANGRVWIIVGTDSGFEGITTLYYNRIIVTFSSPVPVELSSFRAAREDGITILRWTTENEITNHGFAVERSQAGKEWTSIGFVSGHGTATRRQHYQFDDRNAMQEGSSGHLFYRLQQIDFDGTRTMSPVVAVVTTADLRLASNLPNPFHAATDIVYQLPAAGEVLLTVHDSAGRLVTRLDAGLREPGTHRARFQSDGLPSGSYFCRLTWNGQLRFIKMVLAK